MFCPKCGKQVDDNAGFCPSCGTILKPSQAARVVSQSTTTITTKPTTTAMIMLLTSNYAPGYRTEKVLGLVYGITVRSRGLGGNLIAGLRTIGGGEIVEYTELAHQARQQALDRLAEQAIAMGANAVLSVMFDSSELGQTMEEIIAFGTAVVISPTTEAQQLVKLS
jgi:uncharacterized protein YbjQ (UPF0145 family)